jgi:hypothetical protein
MSRVAVRIAALRLGYMPELTSSWSPFTRASGSLTETSFMASSTIADYLFIVQITIHIDQARVDP